MYGDKTENNANNIVEEAAIKKYSLYLLAKDISLEKIFISNAFPVLFAKI